jgi:hypothetical protein
MAETKAPRNKSALDRVSESWRKLPWRKLEQHVYRIQKRIFKAEERGNEQAVRHLQKLLMKSRAARLIAVRRVTQDNQGKRTAGCECYYTSGSPSDLGNNVCLLVRERSNRLLVLKQTCHLTANEKYSAYIASLI